LSPDFQLPKNNLQLAKDQLQKIKK